MFITFDEYVLLVSRRFFKMYPTMTIREANLVVFVVFDTALSEGLVGALRQAGLPSRGASIHGVRRSDPERPLHVGSA